MVYNMFDATRMEDLMTEAYTIQDVLSEKKQSFKVGLLIGLLSGIPSGILLTLFTAAFWFE